MLKIETNAQTLDEATVQRLARLPIRSIQVSLDGDTQDVYGRQRPGASLAKAHDSCRMIREAGLPLEITFAPTRVNIHQAEAVIDRARALGAFRFNTGHLMRIGRAARLWHKLEPSPQAYAAFRAMLDRQSLQVDDTIEICHLPFTVEDGLQQSVDTPPATMLVLPNGLVKVAAAIGFTCADLRRDTVIEAWNNYRAAWRTEPVLAAIKRAISAPAGHEDANTWMPIPDGVI
jgi:MoaA/NifB/PqqE/SkfB family radical SAM enzyme